MVPVRQGITGGKHQSRIGSKGMLKLILEWLAAYLALGLLITTAGLIFTAYSEKKTIEAFENRKDRDEAPWCFCRPPQRSPAVPVRKFVLLVAVVLPGIIVFAARDIFRHWEKNRREARKFSPEGQVELEHQCRQAVEDEISPWVPLEWITERNIPWEEFEGDYKDSTNWSPHARNAFDLLWRQVSEKDEIGYFKTPPDTWQNLSGRAGWVVLRDGKVIGQIVTIMN